MTDLVRYSRPPLYVFAVLALFVLNVPAMAQRRPSPPSVSVAGNGPETYVLISGLVGGVAGYRRIAQRLVAQGNHAIAIDPYQLSIDSSDVSFDALARRVDAELAVRGIVGARIVGHAHGGGGALRLAAKAPHRVSEVFLLGVGAQAVNRSPVFSSSLRLIPFITKLPAGRGFVRNRLLKGLSANSGNSDWLDDSTKRAYAEPILDNIGRVVAMALRLAEAREPESLARVLTRVRVPVTVLHGEIKRPAGPAVEEMTALESLDALVKIETVGGAGHFPHEESPEHVVRLITRRPILIHAEVTQRSLK